MNEEQAHQQVREMLGSYLLGHLDDSEADAVRAHLDGCPTCRQDLAEITPLRPLLDALDPEGFAGPPVPPAGLGELILDTVAAERQDRDAARRRAEAADELAARRARRRTGWVVAAGVALVLGVGGVLGGVVGRATAPEPAAVPLEPITLEPVAADSPVTVSDANLIDHTWGVELRMEAVGFGAGEVFRASFRTEEGAVVPAGEFVGTGADRVVCNLQSSVLRDDVVAVVIRAADGGRVLRSSL